MENVLLALTMVMSSKERSFSGFLKWVNTVFPLINAGPPVSATPVISAAPLNTGLLNSYYILPEAKPKCIWNSCTNNKTMRILEYC